MRLLIFIFLCFGIHNQIFSQILSGIVTDINGVSLQGVNILNQTNSFGVVSNTDGEFLIKAAANDKLRFSYIGKETLDYTLTKEDTIFIEIKLKDKYSQLKAFNVKGKKIMGVSVSKNDNILDYESLGPNTLLVLKRSKRDYQLTLEGVDTIYKVYPLSNLKPKLLFLDVFGNLHLICKDSVRQLHLGSNLKFISTISLVAFNSIIMPIVYKDYSYLLRYQMSTNNKRYSLFKNKLHFYEVFDTEFSQYGNDILEGRKCVQISGGGGGVRGRD